MHSPLILFRTDVQPSNACSTRAHARTPPPPHPRYAHVAATHTKVVVCSAAVVPESFDANSRYTSGGSRFNLDFLHLSLGSDPYCRRQRWPFSGLWPSLRRARKNLSKLALRSECSLSVLHTSRCRTPYSADERDETDEGEAQRRRETAHTHIHLICLLLAAFC